MLTIPQIYLELKLIPLFRTPRISGNKRLLIAWLCVRSHYVDLDCFCKDTKKLGGNSYQLRRGTLLIHENLKEFTCHGSSLPINGFVSMHYLLKARETVGEVSSFLILSASPRGLLSSIPPIPKPLLFQAPSYWWAKWCQTQTTTQ